MRRDSGMDGLEDTETFRYRPMILQATNTIGHVLHQVQGFHVPLFTLFVSFQRVGGCQKAVSEQPWRSVCNPVNPAVPASPHRTNARMVPG